VALISNRVRGYRLIGGRVKNSEYVDISSRFAAGGTRSTVVDLLKYARGIMDGKLLREQTWKQMFTSMATRDGLFTGRGMGWRVRPWRGHFQVSHGGSQPETRTYILIFPTEEFAIAIASNLERLNLMRYIGRLAELVRNEDLDSLTYASDRAGQAIHDACASIFSYGMSRFDWDGSHPDHTIPSYSVVEQNWNWQMSAAIEDAKNTGLNVIIIFHRVTDVPTHYTEISTENFRKCLEIVKQSGLEVATFADVVTPPRARVLRSSADSFIRDGINGDTNFGLESSIRTKEGSRVNDYTRRGLLKFDVSSLPVGARITSVKLYLYVAYINKLHTCDVGIYPITDDAWTEIGVTWNNAPNFGSLIEEKSITVKGHWISYDVTTFVQNEFSGDKIVSIGLKQRVGQGIYMSFYSKEYDGYDPYLEIEYFA